MGTGHMILKITGLGGTLIAAIMLLADAAQTAVQSGLDGGVAVEATLGTLLVSAVSWFVLKHLEQDRVEREKTRAHIEAVVAECTRTVEVAKETAKTEFEAQRESHHRAQEALLARCDASQRDQIAMLKQWCQDQNLTHPPTAEA